MKINDPNFSDNIKNSQMAALFDRYKEIVGENDTYIDLLDQVKLMTPENIHLNSFMYEPILDISDVHLRQLYGDISTILESSSS